MAIYLVNDDLHARDLFGERPAEGAGKVKPKPRQQAVYCEKCNSLDSVFWGGGVSLESKRCVRCGAALSTTRTRSAKLKFYDAIMDRNVALVVAAARGDGDIGAAVIYATYAAHTAFALRLVPYGPEPPR